MRSVLIIIYGGDIPRIRVYIWYVQRLLNCSSVFLSCAQILSDVVDHEAKVAHSRPETALKRRVKPGDLFATALEVFYKSLDGPGIQGLDFFLQATEQLIRRPGA